MEPVALKIAIGFVVGLLVGMTGVGGGALLMPTLVFGLGVPPIVAVGSDMVCNAISKLGAGYVHWRSGNVKWRIVGLLSAGSIPGVIAGVALLAYLRSVYGDGVNEIIKILTGLLLVAIPIFAIFQGQLRKNASCEELPTETFPLGLVMIGVVTGILVGMSSVGSGSILMVLLLFCYRLAPRMMVGTDIVHAVLLTGVASLLHLHLGTVDKPLVAALLTGAIPGGLMGTRLSNHIPAHWVKRMLCGLVFVAGARMLM